MKNWSSLTMDTELLQDIIAQLHRSKAPWEDLNYFLSELIKRKKGYLDFVHCEYACIAALIVNTLWNENSFYFSASLELKEALYHLQASKTTNLKIVNDLKKKSMEAISLILSENSEYRLYLEENIEEYFLWFQSMIQVKSQLQASFAFPLTLEAEEESFQYAGLKRLGRAN